MRKLLYVLLASMFMYSCEKDETEGINDLNTVIQPLEVGYSWTFIDSTFTYDGIFSTVDTSTVSIVGKEFASYDGETIEFFYWKWDFSDRIWLITNKDNNSYIYGLREKDVSYLITQSLRQPYPVIIGDTWSSYDFSLKVENDSTIGFVSDTIENECIYKDYTLKTIIGELNCIVSFTTRQIIGDNLYETYTYFSPNIGYVGLESKVNNIIIFKKTLINYDFTNTQGSNVSIKSAQIESLSVPVINSFGSVFK